MIPLLLLLLLHLWIGSHANDIATQNTTGERGVVVTCSESCDEEMRESKVRNFYASDMTIVRNYIWTRRTTYNDN